MSAHEPAGAPASSREAVDEASALDLYRQMALIRRFEDKVQALFQQGAIHGTTHLYSGQEASAVGVCGLLGGEDRVAATYRGHGHALALGVPVQGLMDELLGRRTGACGGRAGSMNVVDLDHRLIGCFGIVGGSIGAATGAALALRRKGAEGIAVAFFGDGTVNQAYFHECLNLAQVERLPVVFVCENNRYMEFTPIEDVTAGEITARPQAMGIPTRSVDGNDVWEVRDGAATAIEHARLGTGPAFLETLTYRFVGHSRSDPGNYRKPGELEAWRERDPLLLARRSIGERYGTPAERLEEIDAEVDREIERVAEQGLAAPFPDPGASGASEFKPSGDEASGAEASESEPSEAAPSASEPEASEGERREGGEAATAAGKLDFRQAIKEALDEELARDDAVTFFGEDVAVAGGVFAVTPGLREVHGAERVFDTPISELALSGAAFGSAVQGLRPVIEIMFGDFLPLAMDSLINQAAKYWFISNQQASVPMVVRSAVGGGGRFGAIHSQLPATWLQSVPGIKIVAPSTAGDAKALLKASIRDDNPVLFLEHKRLYSVKDPVAADRETIPLGEAAVARPGSDLTLVSISKSVRDCLAAAEQLAEHGIEAEVIDLRTLRPLDLDLVLGSVARTNRLLAVEEGTRLGGWAAGLAGAVGEEALHDLDDVWTLCTADTPIPYSPPLEDAFLPGAEAIARSVTDRLGAGPR